MQYMIDVLVFRLHCGTMLMWTIVIDGVAWSVSFSVSCMSVCLSVSHFDQLSNYGRPALLNLIKDVSGD